MLTENEVIEKLRAINKDGLSEREFYTEVLRIVSEAPKGEGNNYTYMGKVLMEIGCEYFDIMSDEKMEYYQRINEERARGIEHKKGEIIEARVLVSDVMTNPRDYVPGRDDQIRSWVYASDRILEAEREEQKSFEVTSKEIALATKDRVGTRIVGKIKELFSRIRNHGKDAKGEDIGGR